MIVQFCGLTFDMPAGWEDITDDLPEGSPPSLVKAGVPVPFNSLLRNILLATGQTQILMFLDHL